MGSSAGKVRADHLIADHNMKSAKHLGLAPPP
jgi:hypothetical protein